MPNYLCPICNQALTQQTRLFKCENNHTFDLAKEGYVNLLPVQFKRSKEPGDNKAMVNARRSFLSKGYYSPLAIKLTELMQTFHPNANTVLDAGCGEGYYTNQHKTAQNCVYGIDIAKEAIKKAAKKYDDCHFSVGTLSKLPFESRSIDWLYSIYAPILEQEFTRVLRNEGFLLTVTPAADHLIELKTLIYENALPHDQSRTPIEQLAQVHEERLTYDMTMETGLDTLELLSMTPFAFKASEQVKKSLAEMKSFKCKADFLIRLYQK
ncbi:23S rRNA (guanine(745)-N(1))-methyltransferase [Thalassotalea fusca]